MVPANAEERENVHEIANQQRRIARHIVLVVVKDLHPHPPCEPVRFFCIDLFDFDDSNLPIGNSEEKRKKERNRERERYCQLKQ